MMTCLARPALFPMYWIGATILALAGGFLAGPHILFFPYLIPVALASWYSGRVWGLAAALSICLARLYFDTLWGLPSLVVGVNLAIRVAALSVFAVLVHGKASQTRELVKQVRMLEGILPICMFCKKIRDQDGEWHTLEAYISNHSEAQFSHGLCPECGQGHYGEHPPGKQE